MCCTPVCIPSRASLHCPLLEKEGADNPVRVSGEGGFPGLRVPGEVLQQSLLGVQGLLALSSGRHVLRGCRVVGHLARPARSVHGPQVCGVRGARRGAVHGGLGGVRATWGRIHHHAGCWLASHCGGGARTWGQSRLVE